MHTNSNNSSRRDAGLPARIAAIAFVALIALTHTACSTPTVLAIALPHEGFESHETEQRASLRNARAIVRHDIPAKPVANRTEDGLHCYPKDGAVPEKWQQSARFTFFFLLENTGSSEWLVHRNMFALRLPPEGGGGARTFTPIDGDEVLFRIPAKASMGVEIPLTIYDSLDVPHRTFLTRAYRLSITTEADRLLLDREIDLGNWSQRGQVLRGFSIITAALVVLSLL